MKSIEKRVNLACNFFADTVAVDYCEVMSKAEILEQDADNHAILFLFRKELSACGY